MSIFHPCGTAITAITPITVITPITAITPIIALYLDGSSPTSISAYSMENTPPLNSSNTDLRSRQSIAVAVLAFFGCVACVPPFILQYKARDLAASMLVANLALRNLLYLTNAIIWSTNDVANWWSGSGLCDVEVKLLVANAFLVPGAVACIFRQLAIILDTDRATPMPSPAQRQQRQAFEMTVCLVMPGCLMITHYVVQPSRYRLYAIEGCQPSYDNSWLSIILVFVWPLLACGSAAAYCILGAYRLIKHRRDVTAIMSYAPSNVTTSRFVRLFALSTTLILIFLPATAIAFSQNVSVPSHPYSWSTVHPPYWSHHIELDPEHDPGRLTRWVQIITAYVLFLFLGLGDDATSLYTRTLYRLGWGRFVQRSNAQPGRGRAPRHASGRLPLVSEHSLAGPSRSMVCSEMMSSPISELADHTTPPIRSPDSVVPPVSTGSHLSDSIGMPLSQGLRFTELDVSRQPSRWPQIPNADRPSSVE